MKRREPRGKSYTPAMSFGEIADEMGTTERNVFVTYVRAMDKIRRRPRMLERLRDLVECRRDFQERREA